MEVREAIRRAVPVFRANPDGDLWKIRHQLVKAGIPAPLATDIIEFLPLALARAIMDGMGIGFQDYYIRMTSAGQPLPDKKLLEEPVFREGLTMVSEIGAMGKGNLEAILVCGSEFLAVNEALHRGSKPENLQHAAPIFMTREDDPRFSSASFEGGPAPPTALPPSGSASELPRRPWWRFWG